MSEINNTPTEEELNEDVEVEVEDENYVPTPIDPTLSHEGEAADAAAVGAAIAAVLDGLKVNGVSVVNKLVEIFGTNIKMSNEDGAKTIKAAIEDVEDRDATDIMYDPVNFVSVKDKIDGILDTLETDLTQEEIEELYDEVMEEEDDE